MPVSRRGAGLLALAALLLLPAAAHADEMLVMPYACSMVAGQPLLTPGPEQGHRILGPRDQRKFSACSPANPELCRQWTVHRFDLDCDGTRVPWVSVVAATNEGSRRAWLLDGRLVLRMGPRWSLPADDPCAQEAGGPEQRSDHRRMRRYCADRLALAPPPMVEMPFGYAPMLGIEGIFVKGTVPPAVGGTPAPLPPVAAAPQAASPPGYRPGTGNPMPELFPPAPQQTWPDAFTGEEDPGRPAPAAPPPAPLPQAAPPPSPRVAAAPPPPAAAQPAVPPPAAAVPRPAPVESKPQVPDAKPPEAKAPASKAPEPNLGPRIVTSAPAPAATAAPVAVGEASKAAAPSARAATTDAPKVAPAAPPSAPARPAAERGSDGAGISLLSVFRTTTVGALVAFGGLAMGLLTAFALARRNEGLRDARRRPRDIGSVSLGDRRSSAPARIADARGKLPPNAAASAMSRVPGQAAAGGAMSELGDRMPGTRAEAMQVLGIGAAPTANEAAIKKIVDGLRQSWHPDHAKDEADRTLRELRSKQINAAWELLRSQRAMV